MADGLRGSDRELRVEVRRAGGVRRGAAAVVRAHAEAGDKVRGRSVCPASARLPVQSFRPRERLSSTIELGSDLDHTLGNLMSERCDAPLVPTLSFEVFLLDH